MLWVAIFMPEVPPSDAGYVQAVSHAALVFTPMVCVDEGTVLLEVQASLRMTGGLQPLLDQLTELLRGLSNRQGTTWRFAVAPTPLAAAWLARCHSKPPQFEQAGSGAIKALLSELPTQVLASAAEHQANFEHLGLYSLGHLWRLPRSGLSRRFGPALLQELDRAVGLKPDPRHAVTLPEHFSARADLWEHTDSAALLLDAAQTLLVRLNVWLLARQALVTELALHLHPTPRLRRTGQAVEPVVISLRLAQPTRDITHLALLLRERLNRLTLRKPLPYAVAAVGLQTVQLVQATTADAPAQQLFATPVSAQASLSRLVERLQARLGAAQVQSLAVVADHRPERATQTIPFVPINRRADQPPTLRRRIARAHTQAASACHAQRPACLLPTPQPLSCHQNQPYLDGQPLMLLAGPERIETGWWPEGDDAHHEHTSALVSACSNLPTQRDYFVAETHRHALVWVFRAGEGRQATWFLHGHFG